MVLVVLLGDEPHSVKTPGAVFFSYETRTPSPGANPEKPVVVPVVTELMAISTGTMKIIVMPSRGTLPVLSTVASYLKGAPIAGAVGVADRVVEIDGSKHSTVTDTVAMSPPLRGVSIPPTPSP